MKRLVCIFYIFIMTFINQSVAEDIKVNISGNVIFPPCSLNGGRAINIIFDNINDAYTNEVPIFKQQIIYVECGYYTGTPYLTIEGQSLPGAPGHVLNLSHDGGGESAIGVEFYQGITASEEMKISLGSDPYKNKLTSGLNVSNSPTGNLFLRAVIFRLANKELLAGSYSGSATMTMSYL